MTIKQSDFFKVQREQSTIRARLGEIRAIPETDRTPEVRSERETLETRQTAVEGEFQTALDSVQSEQQNGLTVVDAEARELQLLTERASVGDVFASLVERRDTTGETAELQSHCGLQGNEMPLSMLRGVEKRAVTTTAANTQINEQPVIQFRCSR